MKGKIMKYKCLFCLAINAVLVIQTTVFGQNNYNLSVVIEPHKTNLLLGEPLFLIVKTKNIGETVLFLVRGNAPYFKHGSCPGNILIAKQGEEFGPWSDAFRPALKISPIELSPRQEITNEYVVLYNHSEGFAFPTSGTYQINVEYAIKSGDYQYIRGNPVLITVLEPEGENALMWKELQNNSGYGIMTQVPWDPRADAVVENLSSVYEQNATSIYKQYLGLNIGRYFIARNEDSQAALFFQSASTNTDNETLQKMITQEIKIIEQRTLEAQVTLKPEALEVSPGILTAFVRLPKGYPVKNITSATCDGAPSERMMPNEDGTEMVIKFRRQDIEKALAQTGQVLDTQFVVRGTWKGTAETRLFQGTASIKKIVGAKLDKK